MIEAVCNKYTAEMGRICLRPVTPLLQEHYNLMLAQLKIIVTPVGANHPPSDGAKIVLNNPISRSLL